MKMVQLVRIETIKPYTTLEALRLKARYSFQFYNSLSIAAAFQNGQVIDGRLVIRNPFA